MKPQLVKFASEIKEEFICAERLRTLLEKMPDYDLCSEQKQPEKKVNNPQTFQRVSVDVDELDIFEKIRDLIIKGDVERNYDSRSEAVFAVVGALKKHDANTVISVLTNPTYAISESVLEKNDPVGFVEGEIKRHYEKARTIEQVVKEMNEKHAVCAFSGKTAVVNFGYDHIFGREQITVSSFQDFRNYYGNKILHIEGKKPVLEANIWLGSPKRRQYESVIFAPQGEHPNALNLWQGFAVEPKEGDWTLMQSHIRDIICNGDEELYKYVTCWMARTVQFPSKLGEVMICIKGKKGTGKGTLCNEFAKIFG